MTAMTADQDDPILDRELDRLAALPAGPERRRLRDLLVRHYIPLTVHLTRGPAGRDGR